MKSVNQEGVWIVSDSWTNPMYITICFGPKVKNLPHYITVCFWDCQLAFALNMGLLEFSFYLPSALKNGANSYLGSSRSILVQLGLSWSISIYRGLSWAIFCYVRQFRTKMGYLRLSWALPDYLRLSQAISGYHWLSWALSGYNELSRLSLAYTGYLCPFVFYNF